MSDADRRPYLIACTVPVAEYVDEFALTQYVLKHFPQFLTPLERRACAYTTPILSSDDSAKVRTLATKLNDQYGFVPDSDIIAACATDRYAFMDHTRDRILADHPTDVFINRCPECSRIVRTLLAKQCSWCKHKWHTA
ncbi:hypothetical protein [Rhodopirellula baltica]|uniref:Uncharacterized protein n=1 Tax=Rhodopirellula baltica WH47 TaxID=991778 RepID=F2AT93_RHOBT|nr:hypothetical protein [Rhodopirellula baltica]EGF27115.1 hypothetical protein RBWH47_03201 [Rhodopirellula baltica WH47]